MGAAMQQAALLIFLGELGWFMANGFAREGKFRMGTPARGCASTGTVLALSATLAACTPSTSILLYNASLTTIVVEACGLKPVEIKPDKIKAFASGLCLNDSQNSGKALAVISSGGTERTYSLEGLKNSQRYAFEPKGTEGELAGYVASTGFPFSGARITLQYSPEGVIRIVPRDTHGTSGASAQQPQGFPIYPEKDTIPPQK